MAWRSLDTDQGAIGEGFITLDLVLGVTLLDTDQGAIGEGFIILDLVLGVTFMKIWRNAFVSEGAGS